MLKSSINGYIKRKNKMVKVYKNSTEITNLHGVPIYMTDVADACIYGRLNLFLQGDTGSGKTQLAKDVRDYFGEKSLFILGRNDMDTRELFQQINPEFLRALREGNGKRATKIKSLTDKINYHLTVVDELPNCVPAVRAQLFNLFDGFIEIDGVPYQIGKGYSVGIATGNIGQQFTESSNELGRALKDRMHVVVDTDYFIPTPSDTLEILATDTNPRVEFSGEKEDLSTEIIAKNKSLVEMPIPFEKILVANYLLHGLDYTSVGSKRKMKNAWPTTLPSHEQGSDAGLVLPVSVRAAKSITRLSQALDQIALEKGATPEVVNSDEGRFNSMMQAYRLVSAYSGVLNEADIQGKYDGDHYKAIDAVISSTKGQFDQQNENISQGLGMIAEGKRSQKILDKFKGRWGFMKDTLDGLLKSQNSEEKKEA